MGQVENAAKLDKFIQEVKELTGSKKSISTGSATAAS